MAMTAVLPAASPAPGTAPPLAKHEATGGLSGGEAHRRLAQFGPNAMPDTTLHPLRRALHKFWAPVPWMLEAAIVLQLVLGKYVEAAIIARSAGVQCGAWACSRRAAPRRPWPH